MDRGFAEMMRVIREQEPQKPSTRVSTLGETATSTADRRGADPRHLHSLLRGDLDCIVMKCLEKDRTRRYETANGLAADIERHLRDEPVFASPPSHAYRLRKFLHRNRTAVAVASLVAACLVVGFSVAVLAMLEARKEQRIAETAREQERLAREEAERQRQEARNLARVIAGDLSLAVLPLRTASGAQEQEELAAIITGSLIEGLSRFDEGIEVTPYELITKLSNVGASDEEIARALDVDLLLTGSLIQVGDQVQIDMSLDHPGLALNIWQRPYTAHSSDLFLLQRNVSVDTIREVRPNLTEKPQVASSGFTTNPAAREAYYKGIFNLQGGNTEAVDKAVKFFDEAIALDGKFALAYLGRANAYIAKSTLGVRPEKNNEPAREAAQQALDLDPTLAGAWAVIGQVSLQYDWEWDSAKQAFDTALELDPYLPAAHAGLGSYYATIGEFDLCIEHLRKAIQIDQSALLVHEALLYTPFFTRRMDVAIEFCRDALDLDDHYWAPHAWMGLAMAWEGDLENAIIHMEMAYELEKSPVGLALLASVYAMKGRRDDDPMLIEKAEAHLRTLLDLAEVEYICPYELATVFLALGDVDSALEWVDLAEEARSECIPYMGVDIRMDEVRDDPRFQGVMERAKHPLHGKPRPWLKERDRERGNPVAAAEPAPAGPPEALARAGDSR
jgi:tetratricopeptide (TPR) repeat protein